MSPVFMVLRATVIDLAVEVLLNISDSLKNPAYSPSIEAVSNFFAAFLVSVLEAILSIIVIKIKTTRVIAISLLKILVSPPTKDFGSTVKLLKETNT